jgi:hypothetical protein
VRPHNCFGSDLPPKSAGWIIRTPEFSLPCLPRALRSRGGRDAVEGHRPLEYFLVPHSSLGLFHRLAPFPSNFYCNLIIHVLICLMLALSAAEGKSRYFTLRPILRAEGPSLTVGPNLPSSSVSPVECAITQTQPRNPIRMNTEHPVSVMWGWDLCGAEGKTTVIACVLRSGSTT